jgi:hypothetical protein
MSSQVAKATYLEHLDAQIDILQKQLHSLRRERNKCTALGNLPPDVLVIICEYIQEVTEFAAPSDFANFIHTCSYIYSVATSTPSLWASLNNQHKREWRDVSVSRAQGYQLSLNWDDSYEDEKESQWYDVFFPTVTSAILSISAENDESDWPVAPIFLLVPAPKLRHLEITTACNNSHETYELGSELLGGQLHNLSTLTLHNVMLSDTDTDFFSQWDCPSMRELNLFCVQGCRTDIHYIIHAMPLLEVFKIEGQKIYGGRSHTPAGIPFGSPMGLPHLQTIHMEDMGRDDVAFILSLMPNPSKHLHIEIGYKAEGHSDRTVNHYITSRLRTFWQTTTGSESLPHLKVVFTSAVDDDDEESANCSLKSCGPLPDHSLQLGSAISLLWIADCVLSCEESMLIPMITTLMYDRGEDSLGLCSGGESNIHKFSGVKHVIIDRAFRASTKGAKYAAQDQQELVDYVLKRKQDGNPLQTLTFKRMQHIPNLTTRLITAGGEDLNVVWD